MQKNPLFCAILDWRNYCLHTISSMYCLVVCRPSKLQFPLPASHYIFLSCFCVCARARVWLDGCLESMTVSGGLITWQCIGLLWTCGCWVQDGCRLLFSFFEFLFLLTGHILNQGLELDDFVSGPRELLLKLVEDNYPLPPKPDNSRGVY